MRSLAGFLFLFFLAGCNRFPEQQVQQPAEELPPAVSSADTSAVPSAKEKDHTGKASALALQLQQDGLVNVSALDSTIRIELRYSTTNNFLHVDMYGDFDQCFLQPDVAQKLILAQKELKKTYPYYSIIVYDAVRPLHIQQMMWDTLQLPPAEKQKYLSNPDNGSLHNYGAAVDVSIVDDKGIPLDMGTPYDYFGVKAYPVKEKELLDAGELSLRQVMNREILRNIMHDAGFSGITTEWWHFNSCSRAEAAGKYTIVE